MDLQPALLDVKSPTDPAVKDAKAVKVAPAKLLEVERRQAKMTVVAAEDLLPADHKARAICELMGSLDLRAFEEAIESRQGQSGRPAWPPRLLISVWVYGYSEGIGSARQLERMMEHEPGLQWLCGLEVINHHTLSDFRLCHKATLDHLFSQILALLDGEGLVDLDRITVDGTRIAARAGNRSLRKREALEQQLAKAKRWVEAMGDPGQDPPSSSRQQAAQQRAAREQLQRLATAMTELQQIEQNRSRSSPARVSMSEPEARIMKHADSSFRPSYNVQISTDAKQRVIVGMHVSQSGADRHQLIPALNQVQERFQQSPRQVLADAGYACIANVHAAAEHKVELLMPWLNTTAGALAVHGIDPAFGPDAFAWEEKTNTLVCPAGKRLQYERIRNNRGKHYQEYRANGEDCLSCPHQKRCCPKEPQRGKCVTKAKCTDPVMAAFMERVHSSAYQQVYKLRSAIAEFPNAWLKE